jgi:hypothetical protein
MSHHAKFRSQKQSVFKQGALGTSSLNQSVNSSSGTGYGKGALKHLRNSKIQIVNEFEDSFNPAASSSLGYIPPGDHTPVNAEQIGSQDEL